MTITEYVAKAISSAEDDWWKTDDDRPLATLQATAALKAVEEWKIWSAITMNTTKGEP